MSSFAQVRNPRRILRLQKRSNRLLKLDFGGSAKPPLVEQNPAKRIDARSARRQSEFRRPYLGPSFEFQQPAKPLRLVRPETRAASSLRSKAKSGMVFAPQTTGPGDGNRLFAVATHASCCRVQAVYLSPGTDCRRISGVPLLSQAT